MNSAKESGLTRTSSLLPRNLDTMSDERNSELEPDT